MKKTELKIKSFTTFLSIAFVIAIAGCKDNQKVNEPYSRPNIIYILADDFSYGDLSVYGQQQFRTPTLDSLCVNGLRFSQGYAAAPECAPSRGTFLSGLHTGHGPIRQNSSARGQDYLPDSTLTIAEVLQNAGYSTAFIGKWGVGQPGTEGVPYKQGFDYSFGFYDQVRAHTFFPEYLWENDRKIEYPGNVGFDIDKRYASNVIDPPTSLLNEYDNQGKLILSEVADPNNTVFSEAEFEKKALKFVEENSKKPFFLYYATQLPHGPVIIDSLGSFKDRHDIPQKPREWAAMVMRIDLFAQNLLNKLNDLGIAENTIIVFSSDNGYSMAGYMGRGNAPDWPDDPHLKNKGPFIGGKFSVLEGGCRVPFFIHWPKKIASDVTDVPVWLPDLFPTFAELGGVKDIPKTDGVSLTPLFNKSIQDEMKNRALYFSRGPEQAVRKGQWKAYRKNPSAQMELYLVQEDTYTQTNLAKIYPEVVREMENIMKAEHTPHPWYWNPWESKDEFEAKKAKALATGQILPVIRANGIQKLPWEN